MKSIVNVTKPFVSAELVTYVAVQLLPDGLDITGVAVTVTPPDLKVTVGVVMATLDVKLNVTVSPTLA